PGARDLGDGRWRGVHRRHRLTCRAPPQSGAPMRRRSLSARGARRADRRSLATSAANRAYTPQSWLVVAIPRTRTPVVILLAAILLAHTPLETMVRRRPKGLVAPGGTGSRWRSG